MDYVVQWATHPLIHNLDDWKSAVYVVAVNSTSHKVFVHCFNFQIVEGLSHILSIDIQSFSFWIGKLSLQYFQNVYSFIGISQMPP